MSQFYKESDSESTEDLYDKGLIYRGELFEFSRNYSCVVDFNLGEKLLYGKVDRDYVSIEPNRKFAEFKQITNSSDDAGKIEVMAFVADAFAGLSRHFIRSTQIGAIRKNDPYISNLKAYTGYESVNTSYERYFNNVVTAMSTIRDEQNLAITDFESFVKFMLDFSKSVGKTFPITRTGFVRSRFNSSMNSGLAIEITDLSYSNDNEKIINFVETSNFEYYLNACNSYGFMVDISAPWRIVADLDSIAMQEHASRYGFYSTDSVLKTAFKKTHNVYYTNFVSQLLNLYNLISRQAMIIDQCTKKVTILKSKQYTLNQINNLYDESYFIKLYCMLRFLEEETKHSQAKQDQIITDTINLSRIKNVLEAVNRFEKFASQPFDYRGSLSYLTNARKLSEDI